MYIHVIVIYAILFRKYWMRDFVFPETIALPVNSTFLRSEALITMSLSRSFINCARHSDYFKNKIKERQITLNINLINLILKEADEAIRRIIKQ